jgi:hypothetical protein
MTRLTSSRGAKGPGIRKTGADLPEPEEEKG